jgi:hypothetical protein
MKTVCQESVTSSLDEAEKEYKSALLHSDRSDNPFTSKAHINLGCTYTHKKLYDNVRDEFSAAIKLDIEIVKAIRNLRTLGKIGQYSEITWEQIYIFGFLLLLLFFTIYIFWISKLQETNFLALFKFLITAMLFVLLHRNIGRICIGPERVEFEMKTEQRQAPAEFQIADALSRIER